MRFTFSPRLLSAVLCLILSVSLAACGKKPNIGELEPQSNGETAPDKYPSAYPKPWL